MCHASTHFTGQSYKIDTSMTNLCDQIGRNISQKDSNMQLGVVISSSVIFLSCKHCIAGKSKTDSRHS